MTLILIILNPAVLWAAREKWAAQYSVGATAPPARMSTGGLYNTLTRAGLSQPPQTAVDVLHCFGLRCW